MFARMAFRCSRPRIARHYKKQRAGCTELLARERVWPSHCPPAVDTVTPIFQPRELRSQRCGQKRDLTLGYFLHAFVLSRFSPVWFLVTPWTAALQAPLSMATPGEKTGVGCCAHLQGIFPTQGSNPGLLWLLHCREKLYH